MHITHLDEFQQRLIRQMEAYGLSVRFGNDLSTLLKTYEAVAATGYVQSPFVVDEPVALAGFRALRNGSERRRVGEAFSRGALYRCERQEGWLPDSGPLLEAGVLYGYIGAGWVHPRWRGRQFAGVIARIAQSQALLRSRCTLAMSTAVTAEDLYLGGMSLRAGGLHHCHAERVLEGFCGIAGRPLRAWLSHATGAQLMRRYEHELATLREGSSLDWRINAPARLWEARRPMISRGAHVVPDHAQRARPRSQAAA